jgi:hypothetical protein
VHATAASGLLVLRPGILQMQFALAGRCNHTSPGVLFTECYSCCALYCGYVLRALPPFWGESQPLVVSFDSSQTFQLRSIGLSTATVLRVLLRLLRTHPSTHCPSKLSSGDVSQLVSVAYPVLGHQQLHASTGLHEWFKASFKLWCFCICHWRTGYRSWMRTACCEAAAEHVHSRLIHGFACW